MQLLISVSLEKQERDSLEQSAGADAQRALIIGGAGHMGQWFADFLASQAIAVAIADPNPAATPFDPQGITMYVVVFITQAGRKYNGTSTLQHLFSDRECHPLDLDIQVDGLEVCLDHLCGG